MHSVSDDIKIEIDVLGLSYIMNLKLDIVNITIAIRRGVSTEKVPKASEKLISNVVSKIPKTMYPTTLSSLSTDLKGWLRPSILQRKASTILYFTMDLLKLKYNQNILSSTAATGSSLAC